MINTHWVLSLFFRFSLFHRLFKRETLSNNLRVICGFHLNQSKQVYLKVRVLTKCDSCANKVLNKWLSQSFFYLIRSNLNSILIRYLWTRLWLPESKKNEIWFYANFQQIRKAGAESTVADSATRSEKMRFSESSFTQWCTPEAKCKNSRPVPVMIRGDEKSFHLQSFD